MFPLSCQEASFEKLNSWIQYFLRKIASPHITMDATIRWNSMITPEVVILYDFNWWLCLVHPHHTQKLPEKAFPISFRGNKRRSSQYTKLPSPFVVSWEGSTISSLTPICAATDLYNNLQVVSPVLSAWPDVAAALIIATPAGCKIWAKTSILLFGHEIPWLYPKGNSYNLDQYCICMTLLLQTAQCLLDVASFIPFVKNPLLYGLPG